MMKQRQQNAGKDATFVRESAKSLNSPRLSLHLPSLFNDYRDNLPMNTGLRLCADRRKDFYPFPSLWL